VRKERRKRDRGKCNEAMATEDNQENKAPSSKRQTISVQTKFDNSITLLCHVGALVASDFSAFCALCMQDLSLLATSHTDRDGRKKERGAGQLVRRGPQAPPAHAAVGPDPAVCAAGNAAASGATAWTSLLNALLVKPVPHSACRCEIRL
jgi:hypothetical protein